jgi:hypothetical protein
MTGIEACQCQLSMRLLHRILQAQCRGLHILGIYMGLLGLVLYRKIFSTVLRTEGMSRYVAATALLSD